MLILQHIPFGGNDKKCKEDYDREFTTLVIITDVDDRLNKDGARPFRFESIVPDAIAVPNSHFPNGKGVGKIWGPAAHSCYGIMLEAFESKRPVKLTDFVRRTYRPGHSLENNHASNVGNVGQIAFVDASIVKDIIIRTPVAPKIDPPVAPKRAAVPLQPSGVKKNKVDKSQPSVSMLFKSAATVE